MRKSITLTSTTYDSSLIDFASEHSKDSALQSSSSSSSSSSDDEKKEKEENNGPKED